jgi:hypothetical protein
LAAGAIAASSLAGCDPKTSPARDAEPAAAASAPSTTAAAPEPEPPLRYDVEYPAIGYSTAPLTGRMASVAARLERGELALRHTAPRGYLDSLLAALDIDPASQTLVFSKTSLQTRNIRPETPRAIYFNDDTYVAWLQGGDSLEIASMDPVLGPVFHTLAQDPASPTAPERQMEGCLRCHDSYTLSGGGVPRFILGSGYIDAHGQLVSHEGWILTTPRTPLESRWGGWYVTGLRGAQRHLGNLIVADPAELAELERLQVGTLETLDGLLDTAPYASGSSDVVALLVLQHQVEVQNLITRVSYATRTLLDASGPQAATERIAAIAEPLVHAMLSVDEAGLNGRVAGASGFAERFQARGPRDSRGRSLRELDLERRVFRYPLSYLVYSEAFDALPEVAREQVYGRFATILRGEDTSEEFRHLSAADRSATLEILRDTKAEFAAALDASDHHRTNR